MKLLDAIRDARLFAHPFDGESFAAWRTFLATLFAETPRGEDLERYRAATGRRHWPMKPLTEAWLVIGRRGGKSQIAALIAVYLACFRDNSEVLAAGERGTLMVIAADKRQARAMFRYIRAFIAVARGGRDSIDLAPGAHDDVANAALGVPMTAAMSEQQWPSSCGARG
jgi:hypothetical protein